MPKRADISSILVIGAGPIVIGQACEFDYSGTQAVKALRDEGYRVILVNSNPATIMTDPGLADFDLEERSMSHVAVKEAVFPFARFPGVDVILGPERSRRLIGRLTEFAVPAAEPGTAFVPFVDPALADLLCEHHERTVGRDHCVHFQPRRLQIPAQSCR